MVVCTAPPQPSAPQAKQLGRHYKSIIGRQGLEEALTRFPFIYPFQAKRIDESKRGQSTRRHEYHNLDDQAQSLTIPPTTLPVLKRYELARYSSFGLSQDQREQPIRIALSNRLSSSKSSYVSGHCSGQCSEAGQHYPCSKRHTMKAILLVRPPCTMKVRYVGRPQEAPSNDRLWISSLTTV